MIKILVKGMEQPEYIGLLLQLCKVTSENKIQALHGHFCRGYRVETAAVLNDIKPQNLHKTIQQLNQVAKIVDEINAIKK